MQKKNLCIIKALLLLSMMIGLLMGCKVDTGEIIGFDLQDIEIEDIFIDNTINEIIVYITESEQIFVPQIELTEGYTIIEYIEGKNGEFNTYQEGTEIDFSKPVTFKIKCNNTLETLNWNVSVVKQKLINLTNIDSGDWWVNPTWSAVKLAEDKSLELGPGLGMVTVEPSGEELLVKDFKLSFEMKQKGQYEGNIGLFLDIRKDVEGRTLTNNNSYMINSQHIKQGPHGEAITHDYDFFRDYIKVEVEVKDDEIKIWLGEDIGNNPTAQFAGLGQETGFLGFFSHAANAILNIKNITIVVLD